MRRGPAFIDILEEKLGDERPGSERRHVEAPRPSCRVAPTLGFFDFRAPHASSGLRAYGIGTLRAGLFATDVTSTSTAAPTRVTRHLSTRQRQALEVLVRLGAGLDAGFTVDQLRTAFRMLARRYHPDRHPGCTEEERAHLSARFAMAHDAYRELRIVDAAAA